MKQPCSFIVTCVSQDLLNDVSDQPYIWSWLYDANAYKSCTLV